MKENILSVLGDNTGVPRWDTLVDEFFQGYFAFNPTQGTVAGFHRYDPELEDYSREGVEKEAAFASSFLDRLAKLDLQLMPLGDRQDLELIASNLKSILLELESIREWEKNPDYYSSGITESAFGLISRNFAPPEERLRSLIARQIQMPAALVAARKNLKNPPYVHTKVAIQQLPGLIAFFHDDVPKAFAQVNDEHLLAQFRRANESVIRALREYADFLEHDLLTTSNGDFRIGAENYQKKLLYNEMVDVPLSRLLEIGYHDLRRNQQWLREVASTIDHNKSPQQILAELKEVHPQPNKLLDVFRDILGEIRQFVVDNDIVTVPSAPPPQMEETPPFLRALTFASMDYPGPYERVATEAFFNVTLPEPHWSELETKSYMGEFNRGTITSTAIHEVYPGHYLQFLWLPRAPSKARKLLGCLTNLEGWAHYCEQMMLDEGYGGNDPVLRLGQLQDALLRNARYIVGISMHIGEMTLDDAVLFFQTQAYQPKSVAEMEATRGASDPTYLVYTLGKLQIMKLRDDYKSKLKSDFKLSQFHNTFLAQGFPPLKIVREDMLFDCESLPES